MTEAGPKRSRVCAEHQTKVVRVRRTPVSYPAPVHIRPDPIRKHHVTPQKHARHRFSDPTQQCVFDQPSKADVQFAKTSKVDEEEGRATWRGEESDPEHVYTCLMAERVHGQDINILRY